MGHLCRNPPETSIRSHIRAVESQLLAHMVRGGLGKKGLPQPVPGIQHGLQFGREFFASSFPRTRESSVSWVWISACAGMTGAGYGIQHGLQFGREAFCFVIPANAGIQCFLGLDPRLRGDDGGWVRHSARPAIRARDFLLRHSRECGNPVFLGSGSSRPVGLAVELRSHPNMIFLFLGRARLRLIPQRIKMAGQCRRYANLRPDKTSDYEVEYGVCLSVATCGVFGEIGFGFVAWDNQRVKMTVIAL
jgi:hypothetical protein